MSLLFKVASPAVSPLLALQLGHLLPSLFKGKGLKLVKPCRGRDGTLSPIFGEGFSQLQPCPLPNKSETAHSVWNMRKRRAIRKHIGCNNPWYPKGLDMKSDSFSYL